ncbi:MAG: hypothetical protein Q9164_005046 [Protoblastenia rupestris]
MPLLLRDYQVATLGLESGAVVLATSTATTGRYYTTPTTTLQPSQPTIPPCDSEDVPHDFYLMVMGGTVGGLFTILALVFMPLYCVERKKRKKFFEQREQWREAFLLEADESETSPRGEKAVGNRNQRQEVSAAEVKEGEGSELHGVSAPLGELPMVRGGVEEGT